LFSHQGLNLGICDAVALGHTLSRHISSGAKGDHLLEEYSRKRFIVAKNVIKLATTTLNLMSDVIDMPARFRRVVAWVLDHMNFWKRR